MRDSKDRFEYIEHTADLGFRAYGATREALFANAATALFEVMVSVHKIASKDERRLEASASALDELLVAWLNELLFLFETEGFVCLDYRFVRLEDRSLEAIVTGEPLDPVRHGWKTGVKAATYHRLYVRERQRGWECQVFLDL